MKKPQWISVCIAVILTAAIFLFGRTVPKKPATQTSGTESSGKNSSLIQPTITIDSILDLAKSQLPESRLQSLTLLEKSLGSADSSENKETRLHRFHKLAKFWADSAGMFEPFAWYSAEAARLENSEKNLTFAGHLFLENLQQDEMLGRRQWKALQAKDLLERSLKINPDNDSVKVSLGACFLFGNISTNPMEGILKIREVAEKDSTNLYAQMTLAKGSIFSGQYDKAISRIHIVARLAPHDPEPALLLAELYERMNNKEQAVSWYEKSIELIPQEEVKSAIRKRIGELKK